MRRPSSASTRQTRARATTTLSGATFSVTPVDAEAEPLITEATDAAGDVDLSNLALAVDTDYTIAETKAPDGFKLDAEAVTVHIDADGTAALSGEALPATRWTRLKTGQFAGGNERKRPDGCAGDNTAFLAAHSGADVHARRDRRADGLSAACRLRAARAPGHPRKEEE